MGDSVALLRSRSLLTISQFLSVNWLTNWFGNSSSQGYLRLCLKKKKIGNLVT